jgi:antitoxin (DNA-binding transcriptional repressor) of toxin-antitoxin stability system
MAIIGIRDLLRDHKDIFARIDDENEPFLITRHGKPLAALVPVDPSQAEAYVLASSPDFIQRRNEVAATPEAVTPLEEVAAEYGVEPEEAEEENARRELLPGFVGSVFGEDLAIALAAQASARLAYLSDAVVKTAEESGLISKPADAARVRELNYSLFNSALHEAVADTAVTCVAGIAAARDEFTDRSKFGETLASDALDKTTAFVNAANKNFYVLSKQAGVGKSLGAYEVLLRSNIDAIEAGRHGRNPGKRAYAGSLFVGLAATDDD